MATRIQILKLIQEVHGLAELTNRQPQPKSPGLMLMRLRTAFSKKSPVHRKLLVTVTEQDHHDLPRPVKIIHVNESPRLNPPVVASEASPKEVNQPQVA